MPSEREENYSLRVGLFSMRWRKIRSEPGLAIVRDDLDYDIGHPSPSWRGSVVHHACMIQEDEEARGQESVPFPVPIPDQCSLG